MPRSSAAVGCAVATFDSRRIQECVSLFGFDPFISLAGVYFQFVFLHNSFYRWNGRCLIIWKIEFVHSVLNCISAHAKIFWFVLITGHQGFFDAYDCVFNIFIYFTPMNFRRFGLWFIPFFTTTVEFISIVMLRSRAAGYNDWNKTLKITQS